MPDSLIKTAPAARPILMSGEMVRASLQEAEEPGTGKSQTRRHSGLDFINEAPNRWRFQRFYTDEPGRFAACFQSIGGQLVTITCPYGRPGDLLWMKETWKPHSTFAHLKPTQIPQSRMFYRADNAYAPSNTRWVPSMYMRRWMCRLTGLIKDIRVERLQEISADDCEAEGVQWCGADMGVYRKRRADNVVAARRYQNGMRKLYRDLWDSLNAKRGYGWSVNPWVWVVQFRPIAKNVDAVLAEAANA